MFARQKNTRDAPLGCGGIVLLTWQEWKLRELLDKMCPRLLVQCVPMAKASLSFCWKYSDSMLSTVYLYHGRRYEQVTRVCDKSASALAILW